MGPMAQHKYVTVLIGELANLLLVVRIAMKTLKGLRCSGWANLLTILYSVPLAAWPVDWRDPDGKPILHRESGEVVQGEPAFDLFALMDEQPTSSITWLGIIPLPHIAPAEAVIANQTTYERYFHRRLERNDIRCCGFPWAILAFD